MSSHILTESIVFEFMPTGIFICCISPDEKTKRVICNKARHSESQTKWNRNRAGRMICLRKIPQTKNILVWCMIEWVSLVWVIKWCFKTRLGYFARLCKSLQIIFLMSPNDFRNRQHLEKRCKPSKRKKRVGYNYKSVNLCRWTIPKSGFRLSGSNFNYTHMPLNNHNWPPPYKKPENHPFRHISSRVDDKLKKFGFVLLLEYVEARCELMQGKNLAVDQYAKVKYLYIIILLAIMWKPNVLQIEQVLIWNM